MDNTVKVLVNGMVSQLDELQNGSEFVKLLNCSEPDLREEAARLFNEINHLKSSLGGI